MNPYPSYDVVFEFRKNKDYLWIDEQSVQKTSFVTVKNVSVSF